MSTEYDALVADRRALHFIAETSWHEKKTTEYLCAAARGFGCKIFKSGGCVALFFDFGNKESLVVRAETDALPVAEATGLPFAAKRNMHACGHDGHMAIALGVARQIGKDGLRFKKNVLIVFEPAEEAFGGAVRVLSQSFWREANVTAAFALHLYPHLPFGEVFSREGAICAGTRELNVEFEGKAEHIALSDGKDALTAIVEFLSRTGSEIKRNADCLVAFGKAECGTARNVSCEKAKAEGTMRFFDEKTAADASDKLKRIFNETKLKYGVTGAFDADDGIPPVVNDAVLLKTARRGWNINDVDRQYIGDDFGVFAARVPSVYFLLGIGDTEGLHSCSFDFDERILRTGVDFWLALMRQI